MKNWQLIIVRVQRSLEWWRKLTTKGVSKWQEVRVRQQHQHQQVQQPITPPSPQPTIIRRKNEPEV